MLTKEQANCFTEVLRLYYAWKARQQQLEFVSSAASLTGSDAEAISKAESLAFFEAPDNLSAALKNQVSSSKQKLIHWNLKRNSFIKMSNELKQATLGDLIHEALCRKDSERLTMFIDLGADLDSPNYKSYRPIHTAVAEGFIEGLTILLDRGAHINARVTGHYSSSMMTALHLATGRALVEQVKLLLQRGADPNIQDNSGDTPTLHCGKLYWYFRWRRVIF